MIDLLLGTISFIRASAANLNDDTDQSKVMPKVVHTSSITYIGSGFNQYQEYALNSISKTYPVYPEGGGGVGGGGDKAFLSRGIKLRERRENKVNRETASNIYILYYSSSS